MGGAVRRTRLPLIALAVTVPVVATPDPVNFPGCGTHPPADLNTTAAAQQ